MAIDVKDFQKEVIEASHDKPVVVDFWAAWCGPCRMLGPVLERVEAEQHDSWQLAKLNTDVHQSIAMEYSIYGIPAVKLFINGEVTDEFVGALPEFSVRQWLENALPAVPTET